MSVVDREITKENILDKMDDLEERLIQLEAHALTSQDIQARKLALGTESIIGLDDGDLALHGDIYSKKMAGIWIASAIGSFPYLRAAWNLGSMRDSNPQLTSFAGTGLDLTNVGVQALVENNLISCGNFGIAGTDRLYAGDSGNWDIQGNETYVTTAYRGLTMGAWVRWTTTFATGNVMGKWTYTGNQRSYNLRISGGGFPNAYISGDGTAVVNQASSVGLVEDEWSFVAMRFKPSSSLKIYHGKAGVLATDINTTSIPATLFNGTSQFEIGSYNGGGAYWQGQQAWPFLCFGSLPDVYLTRYYDMTKRSFGH
jgi:hypothetical protein